MAVTGGIGPVEPGEDTRAWDVAARARPHGRVARSCERHRRAFLTTVTALVLLVGGGCLYAGRTRAPALDPPPYPSQAVTFVYLDAVDRPSGAKGSGFSFAVRLSVRSGPPVTVTRIAQPSAGLSVTSSPAAPFQTKPHSASKIIVTLRVTECDKAPRNLGFPFLDVTLRNARAIQAHSFILGARYARHLSQALQVACSNDSR
ncbi:Tat pathway signal sequence domain protein [Strepomyces sp. STD 3.1]|uniref:Tat pathway signal sequence domain protein n=1 Tax=Streptomyces sp. NPDC058985 TaxID=3346684 RepID=UPI001F225500|nr:Tat pathway signal sequence domain protein [Streptomyces sp. STD 3.1]